METGMNPTTKSPRCPYCGNDQLEHIPAKGGNEPDSFNAGGLTFTSINSEPLPEHWWCVPCDRPLFARDLADDTESKP